MQAESDEVNRHRPSDDWASNEFFLIKARFSIANYIIMHFDERHFATVFQNQRSAEKCDDWNSWGKAKTWKSAKQVKYQREASAAEKNWKILSWNVIESEGQKYLNSSAP